MTRRTMAVAAGALLAGALLLGGASVTLARGMTAAPAGGMMGNGAGSGMMGGSSGGGMMGGSSGGMMGGSSGGMMGGSSGGMMGGSSGSMMGNGSQATTSYDLRFMDDMIMHHEGAIMSARMMISQSAHPALRDLARRIIAGQQAQIDQMRAWIRQWYPGKDVGPTGMGPGSGDMMGGGMGSGSGGMMGGDTSDHMFLRMMIPHHQIAIDMSRDALVHAQHPLLKRLARSIIRDQSAQITEMEGYLKAWYGETSTRDVVGPMRGMM